jgi:hypothetical protein
MVQLAVEPFKTISMEEISLWHRKRAGSLIEVLKTQEMVDLKKHNITSDNTQKIFSSAPSVPRPPVT